MRGEFATWVDRHLDHLLDAYDHDSPTILADNAHALELEDPGELPELVLPLFRIDLEATASDPEWANRMIQSSYAATFRVIMRNAGREDTRQRSRPRREQNSVTRTPTARNGQEDGTTGQILGNPLH